jgi:indolepyruvate ferredoxin oxidoreductase, alpha subunit
VASPTGTDTIEAMTTAAPDRGTRLVLGDEAVALGALHAGIAAAYSYPGTPATEILEYLMAHAGDDVTARWTANEKTAYEQALGVSMAGRRALVSMKHVGLNVAADPFMNSALVGIRGGLVVVVADDPGMHSSQNEQDSRHLADFARVPCLEPADHQEAYDLTREAFSLSERFRVPVMVRMVTRLCHGRAPLRPGSPETAAAAPPQRVPAEWILLPMNARRRWRRLLDLQEDLRAYTASAVVNRLEPGDPAAGFAVVTTGIARGYLAENLGDLDPRPAHVHVGAYPAPADLLAGATAGVDRLLVLEEGYPFLERMLRGLLPGSVTVLGRETGDLPPDGELTPDTVRAALGLPARRRVTPPAIALPGRPPQLCTGCPHRESYDAVRMALTDFVEPVVTADIGCSTLGALPPYEAIESCVCMGASIGMAMGVADAGMGPALAVIGDSTFLHSGVTALMDVVAADGAVTVLVLDNETVAMTGLQPTVLPGSRLEPIVLGVGVDPDHVHVVDLVPNRPEELAAVLRKELEHPGPSVVIAVRECVEKAKARRREARS